MNTYAPEDFRTPLRPSSSYPGDESPHAYWVKNGKVVCGPVNPVVGADADTFVYFLGGFAKDRKHCYNLGARLKGASAEHFHALSHTFFKDDKNVWCVGGRIEDADASTFEACDDGIFYIARLPLPYGYGKDRLRVFYYDFDSKACWVKKAEAKTFMSFNDGHFGKDDQTAFFGHSSIPKADVRSWKPIGGLYSCDAKRVFYMNRAIEGADVRTFRFIDTPYQAQTAMDFNGLYCNGITIEADISGAKMWLESLKRSAPNLLSPDARQRLVATLEEYGLSAGSD